MSFEDDLRRALRRKSPPAGFDRRVLARIKPSLEPRAPSPGTRQFLLAAAAVLLLALGVAQYRSHQFTRQQNAKADVMAAFEIASQKLQTVKHIVRRHD